MNGGLLIAGFDAGQTHTRCRLALFEGDQNVRRLAEGEGSGVRHLDAPEGEARFTAAIASSFSAASAALPQGANGAAIAGALSAAAIGASGIETGSSLQPRAQRLAASALELPLERVQVSGDELTALEGARGDAPAGILLISGTGCIGLGRNARGQQHRCAGFRVGELDILVHLHSSGCGTAIVEVGQQQLV